MKVELIEEAGYRSACVGFSLSRRIQPARAAELLPRFAYGISGERKFLEHIETWFLVTASLKWWIQADTYRISSKQSESTMYTIDKQPLTQADFGRPLPAAILDCVNGMIQDYGIMRAKMSLMLKVDRVAKEDPQYVALRDASENTFLDIMNALPVGFLQTREWHINYRCLQNIYDQRHTHRLPEWKTFLSEALRQIEHPEFITHEVPSVDFGE